MEPVDGPERKRARLSEPDGTISNSEYTPVVKKEPHATGISQPATKDVVNTVAENGTADGSGQGQGSSPAVAPLPKAGAYTQVCSPYYAVCS